MVSHDQSERRAVAAGLERLTDWAAHSIGAAVPDHVLDKAALVLVDDLAAMAAASSEPEILALRDQIAFGPQGKATIFLAGSGRAAPRDAAFLNGVAGAWCELDEGFRGAPAHAGLYVLPVLMALAELRGTRHGDLLRQLAVAYEVTARLSEAWRFAQATLHPHAALAGMGAAVASGLAVGAPSAVLRRAVAIAGGLVPAGSYAAAIEGALVRNLWTGQGALTGMQALDWAIAGLDGFADGPHNAFTTLLGGKAEPSALSAKIGERWAILGCYHKLHGCCHSTHAAVEAALELRPSLEGQLDRIERIRLLTHRPSMSNPSSKNPLASRFSFEHVVATVLVHGHARPAAFAIQAIDDPTVRRLRRRVILEAYPDLPPWPHDRAARLEISLDDGTLQRATCLSAPGGPDSPLDAAAILAKAETVAGRALPGFVETARRILSKEARQEPWQTMAAELMGRP
jgi:2-methylcitrate dehydratase PrpD